MEFVILRGWEQGNGASTATSSGVTAKDQTRRRIEKMEADREERRRVIQEMRSERAEEEQRNIAQGNPGDVDFIGLVRRWREEHAGLAQPHDDAPKSAKDEKICVCVRKRPLNEKERRKLEHDAVTCLHPTATVHSPKLRVDGISKYLDHNSFRFDHAFDDNSSTEDVYRHAAKPLVAYVCGGRGLRATVFAYGQTGSGKTHTMGGIQKMVADDMFLTLTENSFDEDSSKCSLENTRCSVAIFEIYGGRIQDLLNHRNRLKVLEDGKGEVVVSGLEEYEANDSRDFLELIETGQNNRTTHATEANDVSSRSHAICQILLRDKATGRMKGKLSLVDLAGSERGTDTKSHNRQRRNESSEINTSLLALKECIRALDSDSRHVPYRQSKLTLILKDCFTSKLARTAMIATLSPGSFSTDHTVNTLRYADRIKEKSVGDLSGKDSKPRKSQSFRKAGSGQLSLSSARSLSSSKSSPISEDLDNLDELSDTVGIGTCNRQSVDETDELLELNNTVKNLMEEEEHLLNLHMSVIQENAELLTEEGRLLQSVQGEDYDIDQYASRLGVILDRKTSLVKSLQDKLFLFRQQLKKEEELSRKLEHSSSYRSALKN